MAGRDRALNYAVRVKGQQEAAAAFRTVSQAATASIQAVAAAGQAAAAHDEAVSRAANSAAAFGAAQAQASQQMADAKAAFAAGKMGAEAYQRTITEAKTGLSLFKAENQSAARGVDLTARALVAAQQAAANYAREIKQAQAVAATPVTAPAPVFDNRTGAQRLVAGDASIDRAAISATTLEQVLGRVATKGQAVTAAMQSATAAEDAQASAADRLRARYNPLYAVISNYLTAVREIRQAERDGVLSTDERTAAINRERTATLGAVKAIKSQTAADLAGTGARRAGLANLGYQLNDVTTQLSTGTPVAQIFAQQSGQVVGALSMMGKEGGTMAAIFAGPWGLAITAGVSILGLLAAKLFETGTSVDSLVAKMKKDGEETRKSDQAKQAYNRTLEGHIELQKKLTEELDRTWKSQQQLNLAQLQSQLNNRNALLADVKAKQATVDKAKAAADAADQTGGATVGVPSYAGAVLPVATATAAKTLKAEQEKLKAAQAALADANRGIREAQLSFLDDKAAAMIDATAAKIAALKTQLDKLRESYVSGATSETKYTAEAAKLKKAIADLEKQSHANNRESGREVSPDEAAAIARAAGLQVNSTSRTFGEQKRLYDAWVAKGRPADNPVAVPGTSAHEGAKGRWALDIQFAAGVTPELLRKVFADQGINLTKVFKERGHFHVEGSRSQADRADTTEDKAAEEAIRRQKAYEDQLAQLDGGLLSAKRANLNNADDIAQAEKDQLAVERQKTVADIAARVALGDLTETQGKVLAERAKQLEAEKTLTIDTENRANHLRDAVDAELAASGNRMDLLNAEQALAKTTGDRRDLALAMLAEEEKQVRAKAQETIALFALGKATEDQANIAKAELAKLDQLHPLKVEQINRQNTGALGKYLQDTDPKTINDRVETLVTNELTQVRDGINDALTNALGVKDPMLKGLLEIFLDEVLFRPIAEALQKRPGGGGGGFGSILGSIASLFGSSMGGGGGAGIGNYDGVIMENPFAAGFAGGFAGGTNDLPTGLSWVGENGRELLFNGGGGRISVLNNQQSRSVVQAGPAGGGGNTIIHQAFNTPAIPDRRRLGAVVGRAAQLGAGRAVRKGLAAPRAHR